jgi:hypothetical protein
MKYSTKKNQSPRTHARARTHTHTNIILQNSELNHKNVMVHKVQQFHQNDFSAPDDVCVGQNMCK